jgi:hypothetical protein
MLADYDSGKLTKAQEKYWKTMSKGGLSRDAVSLYGEWYLEDILSEITKILSKQKKETRLEMLGLFESALSKKIDLYRKARKEKGTKWGKKLEQHKRSREWVYGFEDAMWVIANAWKDLKKNA